MDKEGATQSLADAVSAAGTQATSLAASNLANPANQIRAIVDTPAVETSVEDPLIQPSFAAVPTAQSVLSQNMSPSEETSPFTSPYQSIQDDPTSPLQVTPYKQGRKVDNSLSTIEKALMNYDPGTVGGLLGLLGIKKQGPKIKERPSFTEIDLGMKDPNYRAYGAFNRMVGQEEPPLTPKEEDTDEDDKDDDEDREFLQVFGGV